MRKEPEEVEKEGDEKQQNANGADELGGRNIHETDRKRPATPLSICLGGAAGPLLVHDHRLVERNGVSMARVTR